MIRDPSVTYVALQSLQFFLSLSRNTFEQEERQVHGAGDLVRGTGLTRDTFGYPPGKTINAGVAPDANEAQFLPHLNPGG